MTRKREDEESHDEGIQANVDVTTNNKGGGKAGFADRTAKSKKHTTKEIQANVDVTTNNKSGGKVGFADRTGQEKVCHAKFECPHCNITAPDVKTIQIHHESKHPKLPYDESKIYNLYVVLAAVVDTSNPRPGVRGSLKK